MRVTNKSFGLLTAFAAAIGMIASTAVAENKLTLVALNASEEPNQQESILAGRTPSFAGVSDFDEFTCAFTENGGLITSIVDAALLSQISIEDYQVEISSSVAARKAARNGETISKISFPWYRPSCDRSSFLTEHTKRLCEDYLWSEPLHHMFVSYISRAASNRMVRNHRDVFGSTLCVAGREFSEMLREYGVTDLNTRIIRKANPAACIAAVRDEEADFAFLPDSLVDNALAHLEEVEGHEAVEEIARQIAVTEVIGLHAIGPLSDARTQADINTLNSGLAEIRKSGLFFEIVARELKGHSHDDHYETGGHAAHEDHDDHEGHDHAANSQD